MLGLRSPSSTLALALITAACGSSQPTPSTADKTSAAESSEADAVHSLPELDPQVVARSLRGNESDLRDCFAISGAPTAGFMRLAFRVEPTGELTNIEIETSSFAEPKVAACLEEKLSNLRFEAPGEPKRAGWTFVAGLKTQPDEDDSAAKKKRHGKNAAKEHEPPREQGVAIEPASRGSLEPEEIEDIVHAGFGLFAHCYREGLDRHPGLNGVVRLRMVIGRDGVVDALRDSGTDMRDREVVDCVAEGFFALRFPKPRSGTVRLLYRIVFDAG